jgi:hypothetical protein
LAPSCAENSAAPGACSSRRTIWPRPVPAPFEVDLSDYAARARIGTSVELALKTIVNPVTQAEAHPEAVLPEGIVVKRASLAASRVFRVDDGVKYDHSGQYAAFGRFDYA